MISAPKRKTQIGKFKNAARKAECDESEAAFDRALKAVAKAKPEPKKPKRD